MAVIRISCQVWPRAHERGGTPPVTPPLSSCGARPGALPALRTTPEMPLQPSVLNGSSVSSGISVRGLMERRSSAPLFQMIRTDGAPLQLFIYLFIEPLRAVKHGAILRITDETGEISPLRLRETPLLLRSSGEFPHLGSLLNFPADKASSFIRKPSPL